MNFQFFKPFDSEISKRIITVAYPIVIANMSRAMMGIVDMMMVGKLGVNSIAAVGFGEMIVFCIIAAIGISLMTSTQTITARRFGEKRYSGCNEALVNGQILGIILGIPFLIIGYLFCQNFIEYFLIDSKTIDECVKYTSIQFLGILFPISGFIFRGFYTGIQRTSIYLKVVIISNLINAYLNLGLIFGRDSILNYFSNINIPIINKLGLLWTIFPFPKMGIEGAAIATVLASLFAFSCFFIYYFSKDIKKTFYTNKLSLNYDVIKKQLDLSWPVLKREGSIMIGITYFLAIMGRIGTIELAISNIAFRIYNVSIMPAFGVGAACGSIVGFYLGENKLEKSWVAIKDSLRYSFLIMGSMTFFFILFPKAIISIFTSDINLINTGIPLIRFLGLFSLLDAVAVVLMCALDGAGDVKFTAKTSLIFIWLINMPMIYLTGVYLNFGLWGPWLSWMVGFLYLLFMMIKRIIKGDWKNIKI